MTISVAINNTNGNNNKNNNNNFYTGKKRKQSINLVNGLNPGVSVVRIV